MFAEKPAIPKLVVTLDEFDAIALDKAQLIGAACQEVV
jgi:hypothetical protein